MTLIITATAVAAVSFLAGLCVSRKAERWCRVCGVTLKCPEGHRASGGPVTQPEPLS